MKPPVRLALRKTRSHIPQLLGLILLLTVGSCFFITLFTIHLRYEETAEQYFIDQRYADVTLYGAFGSESVRLLTDAGGTVRGRTVRDYRAGERVFRAVSLTDGINVPYIYEGRVPEDGTECLLLKRSAEAMGIQTGGVITLEGRELTVTGLAASPEYIYMVQNERAVMAQAETFGVLFVTDSFSGYNEILILGESPAVPPDGTERIVTREEQPNYLLYRSDLDEIKTFAAIFPLVFAALIAVVIYVMLTRAVQKDRKQIGTLKALGVTDRRIIGIYLSQYCLSAFAGALAGGIVTIPVSGVIIDIFSAMFEVPALSFAFYPSLWAGAVFVAVLLCALSGLIALFSILPMLPAVALRLRAPKGGKVRFSWRRASFNTRYALKNALRNKGRFAAVALGMCGSCALLSFSLGFYDSIGHTLNTHFQDFTAYDVAISFDPVPLGTEIPAQDLLTRAQKALVLPALVNGENLTLTVAEDGFDMVNIPASALRNGVIIPAYFAEQWDTEAGDMLEINGHPAVVSAVVPQHFGLSLHTGYEYMQSAGAEIPPVYNTVYAETDDIGSLGAYLEDNGIEYMTISDYDTSFRTIMETMSILIWFMIACAVILGFTVLYAVGLINLSAREYEYMFMGVMGYPQKSILAAHIKETTLQLILALPLGFVLGGVLLNSIKGEFSGSHFVIAALIRPQSYALSALAVAAITAIMAVVAYRHIGGLDIVEGLKAQEG